VLARYEKKPDEPVKKTVDGVASFRKGLGYAEGRGERHSPVDAAKQFRESADAGNDLGRAALACALAQGAGVKRDEAEAQRLGKQAFAAVKTAAEKGDHDAQALLGRMYAAGVGVTKDDKEAMKWHQKAAEGGSSLGMLDVGLALSQGRVATNDREAV